MHFYVNNQETQRLQHALVKDLKTGIGIGKSNKNAAVVSNNALTLTRRSLAECRRIKNIKNIGVDRIKTGIQFTGK